jgi:hypothetical protein
MHHIASPRALDPLVRLRRASCSSSPLHLRPAHVRRTAEPAVKLKQRQAGAAIHAIPLKPSTTDTEYHPMQVILLERIGRLARWATSSP